MKILVVEDEPMLAATLRRGLRAEGFTVEVVGDGEDGVWAGTENSYDAIVLDIMLPKLNGFDVIEALRSRKIWTPVLMLTARDSSTDMADALDLGADDYLTKPFDFVVLVARLRALIRRGGPARPAVLRAGDLSLDGARHKVARGDVEISLTPREFGVLEFLMRHPDSVVTKTAILHNVWDDHFDGDPNNVEVYVRHLRKKIDLPFDRRAIQTVRGKGYRIDPDGG